MPAEKSAGNDQGDVKKWATVYHCSMLSQQQIKDNAHLFNSVTPDDARQLCSVVLDSLQYSTSLSNQIASLEISDPATRQTLAETILAFVQRLLQARSSASKISDQLTSIGLSAEHASAMASLISSRLDSLCKDMAARSTGDRLNDLEWRFGLTAASSSGSGTPFVQMRISFEHFDPVSVEMGMPEFYEFAADIKKIQEHMSSTLGI